MKNEVWLGDCLELMKDIPDGSIDMILCDLPYGTTACSWDSIIDLDLLWQQYERIIKDDSAIVLFGSEPFSSNLRLSNFRLYRYDIVWNKKKPSNFQTMNFQPGRIHEYIHIFSKLPAVYSKKGTMKYYPIKEKNYYRVSNKSNYGTKNSTLRKGHSIKDIGRVERNEKNKYYSIVDFSNANIKEKLHPTQKPTPLFEYLIKTYTNEGDLVLDNAAGSMTTAIASINTNRNYLCIEKDQSYYNQGLERIKNHKKEIKNNKLF